MKCRVVRRRLSDHLDGGLPPAEARAIEGHIDVCAACRERWHGLRAAVAMLAELPRVSPAETIASRVRDRLEVESRGPGLALLFRSARAARPLMLPSLIPAALLVVAVLTVAVVLDRSPRPAGAARSEAWDEVPPSGTEANPLFPSAEVTTPQVRSGGVFSEYLAAGTGEGSMLFETVVARDGSVSTVTLLDGDSAEAGPLLEALRQQRFEPGRFRGRPVAVSVLRLISRMEVLAPIT